MRRASGALIGIAIVLGACSSGGDGGPASTPAVTAPDTTPDATPDSAAPDSAAPGATEIPATVPSTDAPAEATADDLVAFGDALADDGTLPVATALAMFAATHGEVPGVEPSAVAVPDDSVVIRTLAANLSLLTAEQRSVIEDFLAGSAVPLDQLADDAPAGLRRTGVDQAAAIVREALAQFNARLGLAVPASFIAIEELPMVEPDGTRNFSNPLNAAYTFGQYPPDDGPALNCVMRLNRDAIAPDDMFRSQVAHELFHCFQAFVHPARSYPLWASEGGAGWIGEDFAGGGSAMSATWWAAWIERPQRPAYLRSYDAIGMYAIADRVGVDVYRLAMDLTGSGSFAAYAAAVGDAGLDLWGTHYGEPAWGDVYAVLGPGTIAGVAPSAAFTPVLDGGASFVTDGRVDAGTAAQPVRFTAPGDVLRMTGFPGLHGGIRFGDGTAAAITAPVDFCLAAGGCVCPEGSAGGGPTQQVGSNEVFVGLGPASSSGPQFEAMTLEVFCATPPPVPAAPEEGRDSCVVGRWVSTRAIMPTDASLTEVVSGGAGLVEVFGADGSLTVDAGAMSPVVAVVDAPEDQRFSTTVAYSGSGSGTWSTSGGRVNVAGIDPAAFRIDYTSEIIGVGIVVQDGFALDDPRLGDLGLSGFGSADYVCSGSTLLITNDIPGVGVSGFELTRA